MNFTDKVLALEKEAKEFILSKVKDGEKLQLLSEEQIEEKGNDALFDLVQVSTTNKYNEESWFAIVAIDRQGESLDLHGKGVGENLGEPYIFSPYELTANQICWLADYLK